MIQSNFYDCMINQPFISKDQNQNIHADIPLQDFSSVEILVKLPTLRKVGPDQNVFPSVEPALKNSTLLSSPLKQAMIELREKLRNQFMTFDKPDEFQFTLPLSKFPAVPEGQSNLISYEQKNIVQDEDTFKQRLSSEQIEQIRLTGQFQVRSNQQYITLPYVWKVNNFLLKGKKSIEQTWFNTLGNAHSFLYNSYKNMLEEVPKEIYAVAQFPKRLFSLIFGKKSEIAHQNVNYHHEIAKDFWNEVLDKYYEKSKESGSELFEYLDSEYKAQNHITILNENNFEEYQQKVKIQAQQKIKYEEKLKINNQKKQKILKISQQFDANWQKTRKKLFNQVSDEHNSANKEQGQLDQLLKKENDNEILEKFNQKKFCLYTNLLEKKLPSTGTPLKVIQAIITLLTIMQIMNRKQRKYQKRKQKQKSKIMNEVRQKHKIRSLDSHWYNKKVLQIYQPIEKQMQQEYEKQFLEAELRKLSPKQKKTYDLWIQYKKTFNTRIQVKKIERPQILKPQRTFYSTFFLLPPYKVIKTDHGNGQNYYQMIKQQSMEISTDSNFWKLKLYCMRLKCWTINCVVFLIYFCYKSPFGLRCLYGIKEFTFDQYIISSTGQIVNEKRKPVFGVFMQVIDGMRKSRQNFEALPDRGLFGKNFSRLFNYAECYLFRFILVGLILTLILYPIAIIVSSLLTGMLIITVWAWIPLVLTVTYIFNILVFQFQSSNRPIGCWVRSFPLFSLVLSLLFSFFKILFIIIFFLIISPIVSLFIFMFAILHRIWRTLTDCIMLFLIRTLGRTPSNNTAIAKKISGPGMSKQYYMSINEQDAYILIQSELQQVLMRQFNSIFQKNVNQPIQTFNQVIDLLIRPLKVQSTYNSNSNNPINIAVNKLRDNYNRIYSNYMARYPRKPYNVRFTEQQIDNYFQNTVSIVKNFVYKNNLKGWIFEEYHLAQDDYEQLTRRIWSSVYGCGEEIFEPLQKIDQRFKLEDQYKNSSINLQMKRNVNSVLQAMHGEVDLKPRRANICAYNHSRLTNEYSCSDVNELFNRMASNSGEQVYLQFDCPRIIICPHLRIKQLIKKDNHQYNLQTIKKNK